ncbi:hypothetical protein BC834DRAFT_857262 [Gloeopeniophorella convolvens]|nr:hypothetical protein BC834DRAFT_857262 [Gloeopeniophorella convolvens]
MSACAICLDALKSPVSLPCGHVYCHSCISEAIKTTSNPSSSVAYCPTCREPVSIATPNPLLIPSHLRPYVLPPFRRLYLNGSADVPTASTSSGTSAEEAEKVTARLHMENAVLRQSCHAWRSRANAHVAAHLGLSALVRLARDQARMLRNERDELARKYDALKRKLSDVDREPVPELDGEGDITLNWIEPSPEEDGRVEAPTNDDGFLNVPAPCPVEETPSMDDPEPHRSAKRRRVASLSLCAENPTKSSTSIPAMVIPHLPLRPAASPSSSVLHS